ncbi:MAG: hypothetical protein KDB22_00450 [Planctomycetales bacterium]|nr:hypothetical protein [Planctomycetales bacterium]
MKRRAIVTVITRNYLHFALALAESVAEHQPDCDFYICMADQPPAGWSPMAGPAKVFYASELPIDNWRRFAFQYTPFELSCALKPFAMKHLTSRDYEEVVYLDSDMRLYQPLAEVFAALDQYSIVLTPHLLRPFPVDNGRPGEELFLMAGTYNAGFLAVRNDSIATDFLNWWQQKLEKHGHKDLAGSFFVDQKWLSLATGLFSRVFTLRNPAYNTGHWTLPQFPLGSDSCGRLTIDGKSIVLFHFSNLSPSNRNEFLNCQNRLTFEDVPQLARMVDEYHAAVARYNTNGFANWGCAWDTLEDGTAIHPAWREAIRRDEPLFADLEDPFAIPGNSPIVAKLTAMQGRARKWRRDWRLKGTQTTGPEVVSQSKKLKGQLKSFLSKVGLRRKAA